MGTASGGALLLEGGMREKGGTGWFPFLKDAAYWGVDSTERRVITVQAHFSLCGCKPRLPPVCFFILFVGR